MEKLCLQSYFARGNIPVRVISGFILLWVALLSATVIHSTACNINKWKTIQTIYEKNNTQFE